MNYWFLRGFELRDEGPWRDRVIDIATGGGFGNADGNGFSEWPSSHNLMFDMSSFDISRTARRRR